MQFISLETVRAVQPSENFAIYIKTIFAELTPDQGIFHFACNGFAYGFNIVTIILRRYILQDYKDLVGTWQS